MFNEKEIKYFGQCHDSIKVMARKLQKIYFNNISPDENERRDTMPEHMKAMDWLVEVWHQLDSINNKVNFMKSSNNLVNIRKSKE